jgi:iron complex outermembrane receptor protein
MRHFQTIAGCLAVLGATASYPAMAQAANSGLDDQRIADIVVTAQKRSENVQKVPLSISAFSADTLAERGITGTQALEQVTPSLVFGSFNGAARPYIRGLGTSQTSVESETAVGFYVDGVYRSSVYGLIQDFADIERVEVLKGPQGTLYGRNTTAGAINIITREPTSELKGSASVQYGSRANFKAVGYLSGGTDVIAGSLSVVRISHHAYQTNIVDGSGIDEKGLWGARGKIVVTLGNWKATVAGDYARDHGRSKAGFTYLLPNSLPSLLGGTITLDKDQVSNDFNMVYRNLDDRGLSLTVKGDLGPVGFTSTTAYRNTRMASGADYDSSNLPIAGVTANQTFESYSQEFQFVSQTAGPIEWVAGLFAITARPGFDPLSQYIGVPPAITNVTGIGRTRAIAGYGQVTYKLAGGLQFTGGLRYNIEQKKVIAETVTIPAANFVLEGPHTSHTWHNLSPKISIQYDTGASLFYATASKGFRSGTISLTAPGSAPVNPEKVTAFEVGGKHDLLDRRVRFNWAAFLYNYKNLQVSTVVSGAEVTENAAKERSYGVDADLTVRPLAGLSLQVAAAYLHARYLSYPNASVYEPNPATGGFGNALVRRDVSGNTAVSSPRIVLSGNASYRFEIAGGETILNANIVRNSGYYFDSANRIHQPAYAQVNLRASHQIAGTPLRVAVFADNATDKRPIAGVVGAVFGDFGQYAEPRVIGVEARIDF